MYTRSIYTIFCTLLNKTMVDIIHQQKVNSARKVYRCNACDEVFSSINMDEDFLTEAEKQEMQDAKAAGYRIQKGEPYVRQFNTDGGDVWTYRARPGIHAIAIKYKMYEDF